MRKTTTMTRPSRVLAAMHKSSVDLHEPGLIDVRRMREYHALCLPPVPAYSPAKIKAIRARQKLNQAVMAAALNGSLSTVRQ